MGQSPHNVGDCFGHTCPPTRSASGTIVAGGAKELQERPRNDMTFFTCTIPEHAQRPGLHPFYLSQ